MEFYQQPQNTTRPSASAQSSGPMSLQAMDSMQSMGSSDSVLTTQQVQQHPNQYFSVIYKALNIMVDPVCLSNSSPIFRELIAPYAQSNQVSSVHLEIQTQEFSDRGINNFLRICQNLPSDVQNSEMKEMCEIARMFRADQIYNTGLSFVQANIDPNFSVPENKYNSKSYLIIKANNNSQNGHNLNNLGFEDAPKEKNLKKLMSLTGIEFDESCETENANTNSQNGHNLNDLEFEDAPKEKNHKKAMSLTGIEFDELCETENANNSSNANKTTAVSNINQDHTNEDEVDGHLLNAPSKSKGAKFGSIIYQIKCEIRPLKPTIYQFLSNGHIIYTAKHKENNIYIAEGTEVHINKDNDSHVCHIRQSDDNYNLVHLRDQEFRLNYVKSGKPNLYSIDVSFINKDQKITWSPKPPKYDAMSNKYYLNFHGEYKRNAMRSRRNMVLQNAQGKRTFIVRKMELYIYEVECLPIVNPIIAFAIALSDIVGPYMDPFADVDFTSLTNK